MSFIGVNRLILKVILNLLVVAATAASAFALDRQLTDEEAQKLEQNIKANPTNLTSRRFLIDHYFKTRQWQKAAATAQPAIKELPGTYQLLATKSYLELSDYKAAIAIMGFYHSQNPVTAPTKHLEGIALAQMARKGATEVERKKHATFAIEAFKEATTVDPKYSPAYLSWIETVQEFWKVHAEEALAVFKRMEEGTGDYETYLPQKCRLYVLVPLWDQALTTCQRAVENDEKDVESRVNLAKAEFVKIDAETAKKTLLRTVALSPNSATAHKAMAEFYFKENNFISAADHYRKVLQSMPKDDESYLFLAQAEYQQKNYVEALEAYKKNCTLTRKIASEFKNAAGLLRKDIPLHNKYKNVLLSCQGTL